MATLEFKPPHTTEPEPELHLLMPKGSEQGTWSSLRRNFKETFFPEKLPPLVLTSKPVPVKDIWGFYNYKGKGATVSLISHIVLLALMIGGTILFGRKVVEKAKETVTLIAPNLDVPIMKPAKTQSGGGGGGGDRDKFQAPKGKLPKRSMEQITPPMMVVRSENPKLTVEPTVVVPPQVKLAQNNLPNLGAPVSHLPSEPPSNGTGSGGGIGAGSGGEGAGAGSDTIYPLFHRRNRRPARTPRAADLAPAARGATAVHSRAVRRHLQLDGQVEHGGARRHVREHRR